MDRRLDDSSESDGADGVTNIVYKEIFEGLQDTKGKKPMWSWTIMDFDQDHVIDCSEHHQLTRSHNIR